MWHETGHSAEVTCIARSPQKDTFAVGYADGSIRLWSGSAQTVTTTFNGHKKAVTALGFDENGARLASGSQDTNLIVWDVVGEAGLFRCVHRIERRRRCLTSNTGYEVIEIRSQPFVFCPTSRPTYPLPPPHLIRDTFSHLRKTHSSSSGIYPRNTASKQSSLTEPKCGRLILTKSRTWCSQAAAKANSKLGGLIPKYSKVG